MNIKVTDSYNCPFKFEEAICDGEYTGDYAVLCTIQDNKHCSGFMKRSSCPLINNTITVERVAPIL